MNWNLDKLYLGFESEAFIQDMHLISQLIHEFTSWCEKNLNSHIPSPKVVNDYIVKKIDIDNLSTKLYNYCSLSHSVNSRDEAALAAMEQIESLETNLVIPEVKFQRYVSNIDDLESFVAETKLLKDHLFFIMKAKQNANYLLSDQEEYILSKMQNTGSSAWEKLQNLVTSNLLIEMQVDEKTEVLPLPAVRNMAYSKDREQRILAYKAELESYKKIDDTVAACLNGIKGEVITECELRKYPSALEMTLINENLSTKAFSCMLEVIKEYLPIFRDYLKTKSKLLGNKGSLPFYDLFAPIGSIHATFDLDKAKDFIVTHFKEFSDDVSLFVKKAFENKWIDAFPKEGKAGGAFCASIHPIKESRILANFTGNFNDVTTLAHELGHAFHNECLKDESILNADAPMSLAETASIFFETLILKAAINNSETETQIALIENHLSSITQTVVDIYSRFLFESKVFEERKKQSLSVERLCTLMESAQKEAYGDGLDCHILHPYMWICKPHYYSASSNFYNFPYAFGNLFALGLFHMYQKEKEGFPEKFISLLKHTGKDTIVNVIKTIGIDIEEKAFWVHSLELVAKEIESFKKLCI